MFDKLEGLVDRLDTVLQELNDPDVAGNQNRFRDLMKEQNELTPIVEKYKEYKAEKQNIEDSLMLLEEESDEEMITDWEQTKHLLQLFPYSLENSWKM